MVSAMLLLDACGGVLSPQGPVGGAERSILAASLIVMLCIVVPTIAVALIFGWWFRASNWRAKRRPDFVYSGRLDLLVWSIPLLTIMFLGGIAWTGSHMLDPAKPLQSNIKPLEVQVIALDWKWLFIYPNEGVGSVNRLVLPVGRPVHFRITSASVMNAFFVPRLGSMIYAMNGMSTQLNLRADHAGSFPGLSSHFSGDGFSGMHFAADAIETRDFDSWVASTRTKEGVLDGRNYRRLTAQTTNVTPFTYSTVQPGLFDAVVMQQLPPGPGPKGGEAGPAVRPENNGR